MPAIQVSGLRELRAALKNVSADAPKELAKTNHEVGEIVAIEARRLAPSGPHQGGGNVTPIRESIHVNQAGSNVMIIAGGARAPHAVVYEFGGRIPRRGSKGLKGRKLAAGGNFTRIAKRAYIYPAIAAKKAEVEEVYIGMLSRLVETFRR